ncbi:MAG: glutamine amidotransferase family protein [Candidatus Bathyarchaeia archaeon]
MNIWQLNNPHGDPKVVDACSLFGIMNLSGERFSARDPVRAISNMHERGNGLGGGFAIYGLYPDFEDDYALHIMFMDTETKRAVETQLESWFDVLRSEEVPSREANVRDPPMIWRYFVQPKCGRSLQHPDDYVVEKVIQINTETGKAFVFSSGKNMAVLKGVGYPEDIADFFMLEEYRGYLWTCHGRFPTNTPGWWGGAHPFSILDWTVVHNGELSSYGTNRRYLEMFGYKCTMQTDTEVLAYTFDLLMRKQRLPIEAVSAVVAPHLWTEIDVMNEKKRALHTALRSVYSGLLMNGPFSIIVARHGEMIGLTDRIKLRPLVAGVRGDMLYLSSEESAIRLVSPKLDRCWRPRGGEPVAGRLGGTMIEEAPIGEAAIC